MKTIRHLLGLNASSKSRKPATVNGWLPCRICGVYEAPGGCWLGDLCHPCYVRESGRIAGEGLVRITAALMVGWPAVAAVAREELDYLDSFNVAPPAAPPAGEGS
jgi:hypothetical protein